MTDIIVITIIILIVSFALRKIILDRKRGVTCSSCPQSVKDECKCS